MKQDKQTPKFPLAERVAIRLLRWLCAKLEARERRQRERTTVYQEINRGALIGLTVCALATLGTGSATVVTWAAITGLSMGAIIGLLLWMGSDDATPEDPVVPPAPGQRRLAPGWRRPEQHRPTHTS